MHVPRAFIGRLGVWLGVALIVVSLAAAPARAQDDNAKAPEANAAKKADEGEAKEHETPKMSMMELLMKGGYFMIPIGLCSLLGLAIIIERLFALRRAVVIPPRFMDGLKSTFRHDARDRTSGLGYCRANDCPVARVVSAGIRKMHRGEEAVEQAIEDAGTNEVAKLRRNLRVLYSVAAVAPMLGLLGTVWGMIQAFQVASKAGLGRAEKLATGIYEALVTTFGGLVVAIPVLIFYYYLLGRIDAILHDMNEVSVDFVEHYLGEKAPEAADAPAGGA